MFCRGIRPNRLEHANVGDVPVTVSTHFFPRGNAPKEWEHVHTHQAAWLSACRQGTGHLFQRGRVDRSVRGQLLAR